ncbi:MAG TPA: hypothetical protein VGG77_13765 [Roseiarcus sp.]|jgi:hypothetical protein
MLTKAEVETATLRALQAYSGEQWRAIARVEKKLAVEIALAVSDAQEIAQRVRAERDERWPRELGMA